MSKEVQHVCTQEDRITDLDKNLSLSINTIQLDIKYIRETIDAIHAQTQKTNGRVNKHDEWMNILKGAWIILSALLLASWGMASSVILKQL